MADQEEGIPAPNPPAPVQAPQVPQGQQLVHLTGLILSQNFQENLMKM